MTYLPAAKVMFLLVSVILFTGGGLPQCMLGYHPSPGKHTPPPSPFREACTPPPEAGTPPPGSRLWHTVNERQVCILLECILVLLYIAYLWTNTETTTDGIMTERQ